MSSRLSSAETDQAKVLYDLVKHFHPEENPVEWSHVTLTDMWNDTLGRGGGSKLRA